MDEARHLADSIIADIDAAGPQVGSRIVDIVARHAHVPEPTPQSVFAGSVESVSVQGIRAFGHEQHVALSRGLTIIYAENGAGKTSFIDAVELLATGATTRARQFPEISNEVKDEDHIRHATADGMPSGPPPRVTASWRCGPEETARVSVWEEAWGRAAADPPPVHLLARRRLREVISAKGTDRAQTLGESLGLGVLTATWTAAQRLLADTAEQCKREGTPSADVADAVASCRSEGMVTATITAEELTVQLTQRGQADLDRLTAERHTVQQPDSAASAVDALTIGIIGPVVPPTADPLETLADELADHAATRPGGTDAVFDEHLVTMLTSFQEVATPGALCPGCGNGYVTAERLVEIHGLLTAGSAQSEHRRLGETLRHRVTAALGHIVTADLGWAPAEHIFPVTYESDAAASMVDFSAGYQRLRDAAVAWSSAVVKVTDSVTAAALSPTADSVGTVATALRGLAELHTEIQDLVREVEGLQAVVREAQTLQTLPQADPQLAAVKWALDNAGRIAGAAVVLRDGDVRSGAYREAVKVLKQRLDTIIGEKYRMLAGPINDWLQRLAPDDTPPVVVNRRSTAGRPALDIVVAGGKVNKVKAIGRLSDSQLDMLGLAAHLATLEREAPGQPLFIDDPTDMLDRATRDKLAGEGLARLLNGAGDGTTGRQVIVLTHDDQLVQALWSHHGTRWPRTLQSYIELDRRTQPPRAEITPRSAEHYLDRVRALLTDYADAGDRLWLRSAAGNQTRQALELIVKDLLTVVGPQGLGYLTPSTSDPAATSERSNPDRRGTGSVFDELRPVIQKIESMHFICGAQRHYSARRPIGRLLDCVERRKDYLLDEASHADFVYPSVGQSKQYASALRTLAELFTPRNGRRVDEWPKSSGWFHELVRCDNCPPYNEPKGSGATAP